MTDLPIDAGQVDEHLAGRGLDPDDLEAHRHDFNGSTNGIGDGLCTCGAEELPDGTIAHRASGLGEANPDLEAEPTATERLQASRTELADHAIELHAAGETDAGDLADRAVTAADVALEAGADEEAEAVAAGEPSVDVGTEFDGLFRAQGYVVLQGAVKSAAQQVGQLHVDTIRAVIDATFKAVSQAKIAGDRQAEVALTTDLAAFRALLRFRQELTKVDEAQAARARLLGADVAPAGPPNGQLPPRLPR